MADNRDERMRPIPESAEAEAEYGPIIWGDVDLLDRLVEISGAVREAVPSCIGLSLSLRDEGITLTLVATSEQIALLDGMQYLDGGPCTVALEKHVPVDAHDASDVEARWQLFAAASAAQGVAATLSLPILGDGVTVAGFNLYAASSTAFDGHHEHLAGLLGGWAAGAVTNADLSFATRDLARRAPMILKEATDLAVASSLLAASRGLSVEEAEDRLRQAALRAAVPLSVLVRSMIDLLRGRVQ